MSRLSAAEQLDAAVTALLAEDPSAFTGAAGLARAERLLPVGQRLEVPLLAAISEVQATESFVHGHYGSSRDWLRCQPAGDSGRLSRAQRWARWSAVSAAVAGGTVGICSADQTISALLKVEKLCTPQPGSAQPQVHVGEDQIHGILANAVPALLAGWLGQGLEPADRTDTHLQHRARLAAVLTDAANSDLLPPADRLEPVLTLLAEGLPTSLLNPALQAIVDALRPHVLDELAEEVMQRSFLRFTRRPDQPGWRVEGLLDDETGAAWIAQLDRYKAAAKAETDRLDPATEGNPTRPHGIDRDDAHDCDPADPADPAETGHDCDCDHDQAEQDQRTGRDAHDARVAAGPEAPDLFLQDDLAFDFGQVGPGLPLDPPAWIPSGQVDPDYPVEGTPDDPDRSSTHPNPLATVRDPETGLPPRDPAKTHAQALRLLLADLNRLPAGTLRDADGKPVPKAAQLSIITTEGAFLGAPGAPPGEMTTAQGVFTVPPGTAQRLACEAQIGEARVDRDGRLVDLSGLHRDATATQRRALETLWGTRCAVNGCTHPAEVPHHARWFSKGGRTVLANLVPLCAHHHHDIHEGHRTLRLRDGRILTPDGFARWISRRVA